MVIHITPEGITFSERVHTVLKWAGDLLSFGLSFALIYFYWINRGSLSMEDARWIVAFVMNVAPAVALQGSRRSTISNPNAELWLIDFDLLQDIARFWLGMIIAYIIVDFWLRALPLASVLLAYLVTAVGPIFMMLASEAIPSSKGT